MLDKRFEPRQRATAIGQVGKRVGIRKLLRFGSQLDSAAARKIERFLALDLIGHIHGNREQRHALTFVVELVENGNSQDPFDTVGALYAVIETVRFVIVGMVGDLPEQFFPVIWKQIANIAGIGREIR